MPPYCAVGANYISKNGEKDVPLQSELGRTKRLTKTIGSPFQIGA
jgi:hypothetical protein